MSVELGTNFAPHLSTHQKFNLLFLDLTPISDVSNTRETTSNLPRVKQEMFANKSIHKK